MPSDVAGATAGVDIKGEESDRTFREVVGDSGMTEAGRSVVGLSTEAGRSGVMTDTMGKGGSRASSDVAGATAGVAAGVDIKGGESDGIFTEVAGDSVGSGVEVIKVGSGEVDGTFSGAERETMGIDVVGAESVGMLSDAGRDTRGIVTEGTGLGGRSTEIGRDVAGIEVDGAAAGGIKSEVGTGSAGINVEAREVGRTLMGAGIGAGMEAGMEAGMGADIAGSGPSLWRGEVDGDLTEIWKVENGVLGPISGSEEQDDKSVMMGMEDNVVGVQSRIQ
ncbi:hypothetical protein EV356DRAFT_566571 [Viridothelium virens]|uniref:Uncharacterized protein n=1 Tax=Viridothelium virens TaxID=1048519 RepID=A0A6A6HBG3_VIRVR|nr:hypothetical protein EV356DRAFT_566571 [Viridothelium virens]